MNNRYLHSTFIVTVVEANPCSVSPYVSLIVFVAVHVLLTLSFIDDIDRIPLLDACPLHLKFGFGSPSKLHAMVNVSFLITSMVLPGICCPFVPRKYRDGFEGGTKYYRKITNEQ